MSGEGTNLTILGSLAGELAASAEGYSAEWKQRMPSFFVVGPPRTGTSWLHEILSEHANLPGPTKETRFLDLRFNRGWRWYFDHFPSPNNSQPVGEVAPTYFASHDARERIAQHIPHAKIVFIFRSPLQRLVSLYRLKVAYGTLDCDFEDALGRDPELINSSLYATNLRMWMNSFPPHQLSVHLYEDLSGNPQGFVDEIATFLDIQRFTLEEEQLAQVYSTRQMTEPRSFLVTRTATRMANWFKAHGFHHVVAPVRNSRLMTLFLGGGAPFQDIPNHSLRKVSDLLISETEALEGILNRDLSKWKMAASI